MKTGKGLRLAAALAAVLTAAGCTGRDRLPAPAETPRVTAAPTPAETPPPTATPAPRVELPAELTGENVELQVYVTDSGRVERVELEEYLCAVVAGEMPGQWPLEALKAQAILARTFVLRFVTEKSSKYEGAQISTDVEEAQAYDAAGVTEEVRRAVAETKGLVAAYEGELIQAWFCSSAGGQTAGAAEGLNYTGDDVPYIVSLPSRESDSAPEDTRSWTAAFTWEEIRAAAAQLGVSLGDPDSLKAVEWGPSGRTTKVEAEGKTLNLAELRIALGSEKLRSTLITDIACGKEGVTFTGSGFGHGVGMSQWGACYLAEQGKTAEQIVAYYFPGVTVVPMAP